MPQYKGKFRKKTKELFRAETERIKALKYVLSKPDYDAEFQKYEEWMMDYETAEDCYWDEKYIQAILNEPNSIRRENIMITARRAS